MGRKTRFGLQVASPQPSSSSQPESSASSSSRSSSSRGRSRRQTPSSHVPVSNDPSDPASDFDLTGRGVGGGDPESEEPRARKRGARAGRKSKKRKRGEETKQQPVVPSLDPNEGNAFRDDAFECLQTMVQLLRRQGRTLKRMVALLETGGGGCAKSEVKENKRVSYSVWSDYARELVQNMFHQYLKVADTRRLCHGRREHLSLMIANDVNTKFDFDGDCTPEMAGKAKGVKSYITVYIHNYAGRIIPNLVRVAWDWTGTSYIDFMYVMSLDLWHVLVCKSRLLSGELDTRGKEVPELEVLNKMCVYNVRIADLGVSYVEEGSEAD